MLRSVSLALTLAACKAPARDGHNDAAPAPPRDAAVDAIRGDAARIDAAADGVSAVWPELATYPRVDPVRVVALPARTDVPRLDVGGPAIAGDVAIVSSSQLGFAAVDWRTGSVAWTRQAGSHVAPPIASPQGVVLIGDCLSPPAPPAAGDTVLGCVRVVSPAGVDQGYAAIHGRGPRIAKFAAATGAQDVWPDGDRAVRWRRGDQAISVDLVTGAAAPADIAPPPLRVSYRTRTWEISRTDKHIIAYEHGAVAWQSRRPYTALLGAVYLADLAPMVRLASIGIFGGWAEMNLLDMDATGSLHGQAAFPVPAVAALGHAMDAVGNTAIAVQMDTSLRRDFIVGYAANGLLLYVYPLPELPRAEPIGVAVAPDAVLVFHDGDSLTVLPELSAPATAPGTPVKPSQIPTP